MPNKTIQQTRYTNELQIRLRGDLCPGSGEGFLSGVDSDVFHDQRGIPQIPGRRLKGCLRQAARDIGVSHTLTTQIFGSPGSEESGLLTVWDASLDVPKGMAVPADPADALDLFTYTRAQTKLDPATGTVADGTLRYTRVVKHFLPAVEGKDPYQEATFHARLELRDTADHNEEVRVAMGRIVRALKNLGLNRNRGLGAVVCRLQNEATWQPVRSAADVQSLTHAYAFKEPCGDSTRNMVALSYMVLLEGPVMLPQQNAGRSQSFIPGTSVQGFFASRLASVLKDQFNDVFLGNKVRFSPLYPVDEDGRRCLPTPPFVVKLKGSAYDGCYWNGLFVKANAGSNGVPKCEWTPSDSARVLKLEEGTSFKPGKSGFVGTNWLPVGVRKTIAYHHSTGETTEDDGTLYMQECLCEGQLFGGFVECEAELVSTLLQALGSGVMFVGRSKSAQYGRCKVVQCNCDFSGREGSASQTLQVGAPYAFLLESDVALLDVAHAAYTTNVEALCAAINEATPCDLRAEDLLLEATSLGRRTSGGYNAKWNQKRPQAQVLACGSTVSFVANAELNMPCVLTVGERQTEGYGRLRLVRLDQVSTPSLEDQRPGKDGRDEETVAERCRVATLEYAKNSTAALSKLTASFVGRLSLMVRQSATLDDLNTRVEGLANEQRRNATTALIDGTVAVLDREAGVDGWDWELAKQCLSLLFRYAKYDGKLATQERDDQ